MRLSELCLTFPDQHLRNQLPYCQLFGIISIIFNVEISQTITSIFKNDF